MAKKIRAFQRYLQDQAVRRPKISKQLEQWAEYLVGLFEKYLGKESRILDIGGGWGFYRAPLEKRGHHLTVLDVVKPGVQKAPVILYPGGRIPFPDKSFQASLLITALHHIPDPESVILEARRVTRESVIVVEDLYHHALGKFWTVLRDRLLNFEFFGHPCQFKKEEEWVDLFRRSGLSLLEKKKVYTHLAGFRILNGLFVFESE